MKKLMVTMSLVVFEVAHQADADPDLGSLLPGLPLIQPSGRDVVLAAHQGSDVILCAENHNDFIVDVDDVVPATDIADARAPGARCLVLSEQPSLAGCGDKKPCRRKTL